MLPLRVGCMKKRRRLPRTETVDGKLVSIFVLVGLAEEG